MASGSLVDAVSATATWRHASALVGSIVTYAAIRTWCRTFGSTGPISGGTAAPDPGHVAPGGRVCDHAWPAPLLMAGRGSGRPPLGHSRPTPATQQCFRKRLQGGPYVPRVRITAQLRRDGRPRARAGRRGAAPTSLLEYPGGPCASPDPPARAPEAGLHVPRSRAAVPRRLWPQRPVRPPAAASLVGCGLPASDAAPLRPLAGPHEPPPRRLRCTTEGGHTPVLAHDPANGHEVDKTMATGVGADGLRQTGTADGHLDGVVDDAAVHVMATGDSGTRVDGDVPGGEDILPAPFFGGTGRIGRSTPQRSARCAWSHGADGGHVARHRGVVGVDIASRQAYTTFVLVA